MRAKFDKETGEKIIKEFKEDNKNFMAFVGISIILLYLIFLPSILISLVALIIWRTLFLGFLTVSLAIIAIIYYYCLKWLIFYLTDKWMKEKGYE